MAVNPVKSEMFASGSQHFERREESKEKVGSVQLWSTEADLAEDVVPEGMSNKRQKVDTKLLVPQSAIQVKGGVASLAWLDG